MFDGTFSPIVQTPKTISYIDGLFNEQKKLLLFAGGTHIMRTFMDYPNKVVPEIIDINMVQGLDKFVQAERDVEIGSTTTISRLRELGSSYLNDALIQCLMNGAPESIKRKATIGGAVASDGLMYNIISPLIHSGASVEVHSYDNKVLNSKLVSLLNIYNSTSPTLVSPLLITKVIIPKYVKDDNQIFYYKEVGSPVTDPSSSVVFTASLNVEGNANIDIDVTVLFQDTGFFTTKSNNKTYQVSASALSKNIAFLKKSLIKDIDDRFLLSSRRPNAKRLELVSRIFEDFILTSSEKLM